MTVIFVASKGKIYGKPSLVFKTFYTNHDVIVIWQNTSCSCSKTRKTPIVEMLDALTKRAGSIQAPNLVITRYQNSRYINGEIVNCENLTTKYSLWFWLVDGTLLFVASYINLADLFAQANKTLDDRGVK